VPNVLVCGTDKRGKTEIVIWPIARRGRQRAATFRTGKKGDLRFDIRWMCGDFHVGPNV
jgi:hypothetical protein